MKIKQQKMIKAFLVEEFGADKGSLLYGERRLFGERSIYIYEKIYA